MTGNSEEDLKVIRDDILRLLGRCLVRIQFCELRLKSIVSQHHLEAPFEAAEQVLADRQAEAARMTLGQLVGQLTRSFLDTKGEHPSTITETESDTPGFRIHFGLSLSLEDYKATEASTIC
jgi:hypothetical protein